MIELLVLGATLTAAAWAAGTGGLRKANASRSLGRYAAARGLVFAPAPARPHGASPRVTGTQDGIPFVVDLYRLNGETRTRISTDAPRGRSSTLSVGQRDAFAWKKTAVMQLDEARFDRAFVVMTGTGEDVEALKDARVSLLRVGELRAGVWLRSDGHKVILSWRGLESDPVVLDAARDALVSVATRHRPGTPYR